MVTVAWSSGRLYTIIHAGVCDPGEGRARLRFEGVDRWPSCWCLDGECQMKDASAGRRIGGLVLSSTGGWGREEGNSSSGSRGPPMYSLAVREDVHRHHSIMSPNGMPV